MMPNSLNREDLACLIDGGSAMDGGDWILTPMAARTHLRSRRHVAFLSETASSAINGLLRTFADIRLACGEAA